MDSVGLSNGCGGLLYNRGWHPISINNVNNEFTSLNCVGRSMQTSSLTPAQPTHQANEIACVVPQDPNSRKSGPKSPKDAEIHKARISQALTMFFGEGQEKPLKTFCIDAGLGSIYKSIYRCAMNNPVLTQLMSIQNKGVVGFSSKVSKEAAAIILSMHQGSPSSYEMDIIITQEICTLMSSSEL